MLLIFFMNPSENENEGMIRIINGGSVDIVKVSPTSIYPEPRVVNYQANRVEISNISPINNTVYFGLFYLASAGVPNLVKWVDNTPAQLESSYLASGPTSASYQTITVQTNITNGLVVFWETSKTTLYCLGCSGTPPSPFLPQTNNYFQTTKNFYGSFIGVTNITPFLRPSQITARKQ